MNVAGRRQGSHQSSHSDHLWCRFRVRARHYARSSRRPLPLIEQTMRAKCTRPARLPLVTCLKPRYRGRSWRFYLQDNQPVLTVGHTRVGVGNEDPPHDTRSLIFTCWLRSCRVRDIYDQEQTTRPASHEEEPPPDPRTQARMTHRDLLPTISYFWAGPTPPSKSAVYANVRAFVVSCQPSIFPESDLLGDASRRCVFK